MSPMAGEEVMSNQRVFSNVVITWVAGLSLAIFLGARSGQGPEQLR